MGATWQKLVQVITMLALGCLTALSAAAETRVPEAARANLTAEQLQAVENSPCGTALSKLLIYSATDADFRTTLEMARQGMHPPPPSAHPATNPWLGATSVEDLVTRMVVQGTQWCTAIPRISGNSDDGLKYISQMYWFYYQNPAGSSFAQGRSANPPHGTLVFNYLQEFAAETGKYMDSDTPEARQRIKEWIDDPRVEITDYQRRAAREYRSWNDFFARQLTIDESTKTIPSRPVTMPDRDYIIVAPTDCIMNPLAQIINSGGELTRKFIDNPLQLDTVLDVKYLPISVNELLGSAPNDLKNKFVGGTGLSCILMPNTYHHYHAPVSGTILHAEVVTGPTFGYNDWPNLFPANHNPAQPGTDFTQFQLYQHGVVIIEVTYQDYQGKEAKGYVASLPVGLDTIGSVQLVAKKGDVVTRGYSEIGYFLYGGSLDILLFSKGLATESIQTRMGNQIGVIDTGSLP
jgi:phosphatidylserine decarboxylase